MKRVIFLSLLAALFVLGCDDDGGGGGSQADYDAALASLVNKSCVRMVECCVGSYASVEDCVADQDTTPNFSDKVTIDYAQATECVNARTANLPDSCEEEYIPFENTQTDECEGISIGLTLEGEECSGQSECEPGTYCYDDWDGGGYTVCTVQKELNEPCESQDWGEPCVWGLVCLEGTCVNPRGIGEACEYAYQCGADYLAGVWCIDHICDHLRESGEECTYSDDCLSDVCDGNICVAQTYGDTCDERR